METFNIPRLDLLEFTQGNSEQREKFSKDIGKAFNETGFVTIANHGLSPQEIDELYKTVKAFFDLPLEVKQKYEFPEYAGQRGYTSPGKETAKGAKVPDLKEFWQRGQTIRDEEYSKADFPDNPKVDELPEFDVVTGEVYRKLENAGRELLKAIALYLGLDEFYFEKFVFNGNSILRAIHYFPIEKPEELAPDAVRAGAHEDINLITLLIGASAEGFENSGVVKYGGNMFYVTNRYSVNMEDLVDDLEGSMYCEVISNIYDDPEMWEEYDEKPNN